MGLQALQRLCGATTIGALEVREFNHLHLGREIAEQRCAGQVHLHDGVQAFASQ